MTDLTTEGWTIDETGHPLGTLVDRRTVRYERSYPVSMDRLWRAIVDEKELGRWWIPLPCRLEARLGGRFWFGSERDEVMSGVVIDLEPGRRMLLAFRNGSGAHFGLQPGEDDARLTFTHWLPAGFVPEPIPGAGWAAEWTAQPGGPGSYPPALAACWHGSLYGLAFHLGAPRPARNPSTDAGAPFPVEWYGPYLAEFSDRMPEW
jgi:uncharacterized protein YndB with AHSA1/START domain